MRPPQRNSEGFIMVLCVKDNAKKVWNIFSTYRRGREIATKERSPYVWKGLEVADPPCHCADLRAFTRDWRPFNPVLFKQAEPHKHFSCAAWVSGVKNDDFVERSDCLSAFRRERSERLRLPIRYVVSRD